MLRVKRLQPAAALIVLFALAGPAGAQTRTTHPVIHLDLQAASGAELGVYGLNGWDRITLGARARAMGGAFLGMNGEAASAALNPASLTSLSTPELMSESRYRLGSANVTQSPSSMMDNSFGRMTLSDYRPGVATTYTYNELSFGMPLVLMARRAAVALSYHRMIDFRGGEETRFKVVTSTGSADYGQANEFKGGVDAITPAVALDVTNWLSVGAALNFMNGSLDESGDQGVTTFGMVVSRGGLSLTQDVYGTSLDLGARLRVNDRIRVGAVLQKGHQLKFRNGHNNVQQLYTTDLSSPIRYYDRSLMDHDLSVPTKYGAGVSWSLLNDRMTLGADYWNQAWSHSEITRNAFTTAVFFPDTLALLNGAQITAVPGTGQVKVNAGLNNTHHIRLGMEYLIRKSADGGVEIPLRIGFRNEPFTFANFDTTRYDEAYRAVLAAATDSTITLAQKEQRITSAIDNIYQNGARLLSGSKVPATTITAGTGVRIGTFSADFAVARTSYTVQRLFLGAFADFTQNLALKSATESRSITEFTFTTSLRF